jgi:GNAT superfamily N-acetyltransferase
VTAPFSVEGLRSQDRSNFSSGVAALDRYFREYVTQDVRRRATSCYVAIEAATVRVGGFYTLSASGIPLGEVGESVAKRLPRYPSVPVARLGRLAVDQDYRGRGLGALLLADAAIRAARSEVMVFALVVDAKDEQAEAFYQHHGFMRFGSSPLRLMMPLAKLRER